MTDSGATWGARTLAALAFCFAWAPAVARASSYEGAFALFGIPFMALGALLAAVCWGVASAYHRAAVAAFAVAVLNACAMSLLAMLLTGDLLIAGGAVFQGSLAGFRILMLLLVLSMWALAVYAPFQVLKYEAAGRKEKTVEFLDESHADDEDRR